MPDFGKFSLQKNVGLKADFCSHFTSKHPNCFNVVSNCSVLQGELEKKYGGHVRPGGHLEKIFKGWI
jgi:hypothetical protein